MELVYKREKPLFILSVIISLIIWLGLIVGTLGVALVYLLFGFVFYLFAQSAFISHLKGTAVRITPEQFPDLYQQILDCCKTLNMQKTPEAYLLHADGIFNALATRFLGRDFVALYSDVVDALESRPGAIKFYIGHELGHIQRGHIKWAPVLLPASMLPLIGAAYSRAREYTCDRHGFACCEDREDAAFGLAALAAGGKRWRSLNKENYAAQSDASRGFWMSFHELVGDYPWLVKRMAALNALTSNNTPEFPRRSALAWLFAMFVPRLGVGGGGGSVLVTVAMIGVIMAIATPAYLATTAKSRITAALADSGEIRSAVEKYAVENKAWPADNDALGLPANAVWPSAKDIESVTVEDGIIYIMFSQGAIKGKELVLSSTVEEGIIKWRCSSEDIPMNLLPPECR